MKLYFRTTGAHAHTHTHLLVLPCTCHVSCPLRAQGGCARAAGKRPPCCFSEITVEPTDDGLHLVFLSFSLSPSWPVTYRNSPPSAPSPPRSPQKAAPRREFQARPSLLFLSSSFPAGRGDAQVAVPGDGRVSGLFVEIKVSEKLRGEKNLVRLTVCLFLCAAEMDSLRFGQVAFRSRAAQPKKHSFLLFFSSYLCDKHRFSQRLGRETPRK